MHFSPFLDKNGDISGSVRSYHFIFDINFSNFSTSAISLPSGFP